MKNIKLSKRLEAVAAFITPGARVADIGTDHGHIPVSLAQSGLAARIIASDIAEGPLSSARRTACEYGVLDKITFISAPGLSGVGENDADTVIIAGMGGDTIINIISNAPWTKIPGVKLILQPQTKTDALCRWLRANGYVLQDASLTHDGGKLYVVILAGADDVSGSDPDGGLLALLANKRDPLFEQYVDMLIIKTRRALDGLSRSPASEDELQRMTDRLIYLTAFKEEAESWQR